MVQQVLLGILLIAADEIILPKRPEDFNQASKQLKTSHWENYKSLSYYLCRNLFVFTLLSKIPDVHQVTIISFA